MVPLATMQVDEDGDEEKPLCYVESQRRCAQTEFYEKKIRVF